MEDLLWVDGVLAFGRSPIGRPIVRLTNYDLLCEQITPIAARRQFLSRSNKLGNGQWRHFELAPKVLSLGYAFLSANHYRSAIQQILEEITTECGESSSLGVLDGDDVTYVARSSSRHRLTLSVGTRLPAPRTPMGRVLLAQLPEAGLDALLARPA